MFLLVPAHPDCSGQNPESHKMAVSACGLGLVKSLILISLHVCLYLRQTDRETDRGAGDDGEVYLIRDLLLLPISKIESAVGKRLITHCCVSRPACSRLSGHIEPHLPDFKREINTTTTVMN